MGEREDLGAWIKLRSKGCKARRVLQPMKWAQLLGGFRNRSSNESGGLFT